MGRNPFWEVLIIFILPIVLLLTISAALPAALFEPAMYGLGVFLFYWILLVLVMAAVTYFERKIRKKSEGK